MFNLKTIAGLFIIVITAQQSLAANENYRTGKTLCFSPIITASMLVLFLVFGVFLIVKGVRREQLF